MTTPLIKSRCEQLAAFVRERAEAKYPAPSNAELGRALGVSSSVVQKTLPYLYETGAMTREGQNLNYRFVFPDGVATAYRKHSRGPHTAPSRRPASKLAADIGLFWGGAVRVKTGPGGEIMSDMINGLPRNRA